MGQQREHNRWLWNRVLGKKSQMGLCLWKSPLCLRTANRRGWVRAPSCCGTLGSDERRVPVVKTAKDQVFHRWRQGRTSTERWLRIPATLMLATAQEGIWFSEEQSTLQHPLVAGEQGLTQIFGEWLFSTALEPCIGTPSLANITSVGGVWLAVLGHRGNRSAMRALPAFSDCSEREPWALPPRCLLYLLGRTVHFVTQHDHCLSVSGKPHGQAALLCLKRTCFATSRRNLAEKLDPNSVLGGAVSTTDTGKASDSLCNNDIFPISKFLANEMARWNGIQLGIDSNSQIYRVELRGIFQHSFFPPQSVNFLIKKGKKERENFLLALPPSNFN